MDNGSGRKHIVFDAKATNAGCICGKEYVRQGHHLMCALHALSAMCNKAYTLRQTLFPQTEVGVAKDS
jgi:hypothetical protein